jgi:hypothetical protein
VSAASTAGTWGESVAFRPSSRGVNRGGGIVSRRGTGGATAFSCWARSREAVSRRSQGVGCANQRRNHVRGGAGYFLRRAGLRAVNREISLRSTGRSACCGVVATSRWRGARVKESSTRHVVTPGGRAGPLVRGGTLARCLLRQGLVTIPRKETDMAASRRAPVPPGSRAGISAAGQQP